MEVELGNAPGLVIGIGGIVPGCERRKILICKIKAIGFFPTHQTDNTRSFHRDYLFTILTDARYDSTTSPDVWRDEHLVTNFAVRVAVFRE